ncbi:MAG TPA: CCA tRNA nucleotidyltransferase [Candidatus Dorea intestinavium]|nr:CCA tRNA nucleotidyltransferase [Candidatus Dorea intestinavium]
MKKITIPQKANFIIERLLENNYEAYAVGGCIRDSLLERNPEDWDITTSATPAEVKSLFKRTIDTGIKHGTVTILLEKETFEVTTYRIDGKYEDSRHPTKVEFTKSLKEDLRRRDFTINAMAYNNREGLVDVFGGKEDLERKIIRCVGDAHKRLSEDALRILRGLRFSAQLGFAIEADTKEAMKELVPLLKNISAERIQVELIKTITAPNPELLILAYELGMTKEFLPEFDQMMETKQETIHHQYNVGIHTIEAMKNIAPEKVRRLTMLFHDMGKPAYKTMGEDGIAHFKKHNLGSTKIAKEVLKRLRLDNDTIKKVEKLVYYHDYRMPTTPYHVRKAIYEIGKELFPIYLEVRRADTLAQSLYKRAEKLADIGKIENLYQEVLEKNQCVSLKEMAVSGKDLIKLGIKPGKQIGEILEQLFKLVLKDPDLNKKELLLQEVERSFL